MNTCNFGRFDSNLSLCTQLQQKGSGGTFAHILKQKESGGTFAHILKYGT